MTNSTPNPRYPQLRAASATLAVLAMVAAVTGLAGSGAVLAWAVATLSLTVFGASFYLKS